MKLLIALHLVYLDQWDDIKSRLLSVPVDFDLHVTVVEQISDVNLLSYIENDIHSNFKSASIFRVNNKGADLGGFFYVMSELMKANREYDLVIKIHTKGDSQWRNKLLMDILPESRAFTKIINQFSNDDSMGMYGSYLYPYDYYNINHVLFYCKKLALPVNTGWAIYKNRNKLFDVNNIAELIKHSLVNQKFEDRPDIDVEGYLTRHATLDHQFNEENRDWFIDNGFYTKLPYYPGTMYWIKFDIIFKLNKVMKLEDLYQDFEDGYESDCHSQKVTHAWERLLPIYAQMIGYSVWQAANE